MKTEPQFQFSKEQQEEIKETLKKYFSKELDLDIGNLETDIYLDYLSEHIGKYYYNLGVADAIAALKEKTDDLVLLVKE